MWEEFLKGTGMDLLSSYPTLRLLLRNRSAAKCRKVVKVSTGRISGILITKIRSPMTLKERPPSPPTKRRWTRQRQLQLSACRKPRLLQLSEWRRRKWLPPSVLRN